MLVTNAVRLLARHGAVEVKGRRYSTSIGQTIIEFTSLKGEVIRLRCRKGESSWRPKSLTDAVRSALGKSRLVSGPDGINALLSVGIDRRGRQFRPVACCILMCLGPVEGASAEWSDSDAIAMTESFIEGAAPDGVLLDWLQERGGEVAGLLEARRAGRAARGPTASHVNKL